MDDEDASSDALPQDEVCLSAGAWRLLRYDFARAWRTAVDDDE